MSEYIIDTEKINELNRGNVTSWLSPYAISDTSVFPPRIKETHFAVTLPGIVRCRDCKHYAEWDEYHPTNPWTCRWCKFWDDQTKIDGFCHAGERKVDA